MIYHTDIPLQQQPDCFDFSIDISDRPHLHAFFMLDLRWQVLVQRVIAADCKVSGGGWRWAGWGGGQRRVPRSLVHSVRPELPARQSCLLCVPEACQFLQRLAADGFTRSARP